jgi:hypothetical protein
MLDGSQYGFAGLWESWKEQNGTLTCPLFLTH